MPDERPNADVLGVARALASLHARIDHNAMTTLSLRPIGKDDYAVLDAGEPVGRVRRAAERKGKVWMWNVTVCIPGAGSGTASGLEEAKTAFRSSWLPFKAAAGAERLAEAFDLARAALDRTLGTKAPRPA